MTRWILGVVAAFAAGAIAAVAWAQLDRPPPERAARVEQSQPGPGDPPVVWLSGRLATVSDRRLTVQEGEGPTIELERFAEGATRFFRLRDAEWRAVPPGTAEGLAGDTRVCVESLLDGQTYLALRVFLGTVCGPQP